MNEGVRLVDDCEVKVIMRNNLEVTNNSEEQVAISKTTLLSRMRNFPNFVVYSI